VIPSGPLEKELVSEPRRKLTSFGGNVMLMVNKKATVQDREFEIMVLTVYGCMWKKNEKQKD